MAKRRKHKKKSSKCPEPINSLLDLAGGLAMGAVANHMEKKYNYTKKGKINPYTVSAFGIASGRMNSSEDLIRTGAFLGAIGSFDIDSDDVETHYVPHLNIPEDPIFRDIRETSVNNNKYAWRLNCDDASLYGISPNDYETKAEYNTALAKAKKDSIDNSLENEQSTTELDPNVDDTDKYFQFLRISRLDNGINQYYLSENANIKIGDTVTVPTEYGFAKGIVVAVEMHSAKTAPQSPNKTQWIAEHFE